MSLEINITTAGKIRLDSLSFNKSKSEIVVFNSIKNELQLRLNILFNLKKTTDNLYDSTVDIDKIFIFRNRFFKEKSLIRLKYKVGESNKNIGFAFSLRGILEADNILQDNEDIIPYALRSLIMLLNNKTTLPAKVPDYNPTTEFELMDFYDDDLIVCAVSKQQLVNYTIDFEMSLLYQLNLYGFYLLNSDENRLFMPNSNSFHQTALNYILNSENLGLLIIQKISEKIIHEPYFKTYITTLINRTQNYISKFFLIYQCFEILIDIVAKIEIKTKVCETESIIDKSGFQVKELMIEIGTESYRIKKLFSHYSNYPFESDYHISAEILYFLEKHKANYESKQNQTYGSYFYELRNILTHNLRILFSGTVTEVDQKVEELNQLVTNIEFLTIETLLGLKI